MQQFSFIDLFIDLFESALHVSGDKEHFWLHIQVWYNAPVGSNIGALYQPVYAVKKCSWRWAILSPVTCRVDLKRSIKISINENCCIFFVAYIVVLMMHGLRNVKNILNHEINTPGFSWQITTSVTASVFNFQYDAVLLVARKYMLDPVNSARFEGIYAGL